MRQTLTNVSVVKFSAHGRRVSVCLGRVAAYPESFAMPDHEAREGDASPRFERSEPHRGECSNRAKLNVCSVLCHPVFLNYSQVWVPR